MKKPDPIHSYDFNIDGWVPRYCINCGLCNDSEKIIVPRGIIGAFGNRFIERVLENICRTKLDKNFIFKKEVIKLMKDKIFFSVADLTNQIDLFCSDRGYPITRDSISNIIYSELNDSAFVEFTVKSM